MKKYFTILVVLFLTSCASYHQLMVGPDGSITDCWATGQGLIGMSVAQTHTDNCADNLRKAGYLPIEEAGVIGIMLSSDDSLYVIKVHENSPASKAGMKVGNKLIKIDSQPVHNTKDAKLLLMGKKDTPVNIAVLADGAKVEYNLIRASYVETFGTPK